MQGSTPKNAHLLNLSNSVNVTHSSLPTEKARFPPKPSNKVFEKLSLETFKREPCQLTHSHNHKQCIFYHNAQDRKRAGNFYSEDLCEFRKANQACPKGELCEKSHNQVEQLYREEKFKKKFCLHYPKNLEKCEYGRYCSFAHDESEILTELIHNYVYDMDFYIFHYKTVSCPYNLNHHVKSLCVYAHNWQDFRRKPNAYDYDPVPCPFWNPNDHIVNYEKGCPYMFNCMKCHGWKEAEYHPLNYKTRKCPNEKNCRRNQDCPHYHNAEEQRTIGSLIQFQFFKFVPRNRIIEKTFKMPEKSVISELGEHSSDFSVETKAKESAHGSHVFHENKQKVDPGSDTLPFIQEERMRGYSLKNKQREANLLLIEKKKKRFSCEDPAENAFESSKLKKEEEHKDEENKSFTKDSFMIASVDLMNQSQIPVITRKDDKEKNLFSIMSGSGEYEDNEHNFILSKILE